MSKFELLGFDDAGIGYPCPVIPVGRLDGQLVAIYPGGKTGPTPDPIDEDALYTKLDNAQKAALSKFDWRNDRLFGYTEKEVVSYSRADEKKFLAEFLDGPKSKECCSPQRHDYLATVLHRLQHG